MIMSSSDMENDALNYQQGELFNMEPVSNETQDAIKPLSPRKRLKKLSLPTPSSNLQEGRENVYQAIPAITLPTRWEKLESKIKNDTVSLRTIVRPIPDAMIVVRNIINYLRVTDGCQVLVIHADTGSGKTTFLNTLPHYMQDINLHIRTIDLQPLSEEGFATELWKLRVVPDGINMIILEGRERPKSITNSYIENVLSNINRFGRSTKTPILFVIPTNDDEVARLWCDVGSHVGDLIPAHSLFEGSSRWYNFPGVDRSEYVEVVEETVRTLNPPYNLYRFGISPDEVKSWVETSPTIGKFIETLANKVTYRRGITKLVSRGKKDHVWIVYCAPDSGHYDHTYITLDGLVQDEMFRVAPNKLVAPESGTTLMRGWREPAQWAKLIASLNFLDVRLINFPIITVVTAALTYGEPEIIESFKRTTIAQYKDKIIRELPIPDNFNWDISLADRRLQVQNARDSIERSNLFFLLREMPAARLKGGNIESVKVLAQYLHLREIASESKLHLYIGQALRDLLEHNRYTGLVGVETEKPLVKGQTDPVPDITVHTDNDIYALEFHFMRRQITPSEISRYALTRVIEKYMKSLPYLSSQLDKIRD